MENMKEIKKLEIIFGGDLHSIDVDVLIEALVSYSTVTQDAASYLSPGVKVDIKITAPKEGSFIISLILETYQNIVDLFSPENISYASGIVTIVGGLYKFKKWISKNGKPETIKSDEGNNSVEISNPNGSIVINQTVYNIYQENPRVRENLRNTFTKLKEKEEITDFTIRDCDSDEDIFTVENKDFKLLANFDDEIEQKKQKVLKNMQELSVFKVVFKENYKWEFYYQGIKVYVSLKDKDFFKKIEKGEIAFRSGDRMIVDLEIEQIFNEAANTFVNDAYNILKVYEHIPRISYKQPSLDFPD